MRISRFHLVGWFFLAACLVPGGWVSAWAQETRPVKRVGVLTDNFPYSFRGDGGRVEGFVYDLVAELEATMGLRFERVEGDTREINQAFVEGRLDALQSYAEFPERKSHADFSVPYLTMEGAIVVRRDENRIRGVDDLRGRRVLVHRGSMGETVLRRLGLEEAIVFVDSVEQALIQLDQGEGDATLVTRLSGLSVAHRLGLKNLRALDAKVEGYDVRYCFAVRSGDRELLAQVNEGLATLVSTGRFAALYDKWFGHIKPAAYTFEQVILAIASGLALALVIALLAFFHQKKLRRQIARQAGELRVSEEQHRAVFEGARDGLLVLRGGSDDLLVDQSNPAARRLLGAPGALAEAAPLATILPGDSSLVARIRSAAAAGRTEEFEHEHSRGWLRVVVNPLAGRTLVALADIREQVEARQRLRAQEEHLRQKQKLEAVGTLAGGVAHDFNNLLTAIIGNTEIVLMNPQLDPADRAALDQVIVASRRARDLVRQILAFSRQAAPRREVLAVGPLVEETINLLRTLARGAVKFEAWIPPALPKVSADPGQLHQVLMNIGTNAVQAMAGSPGRLSFHASAVEIGEETGGQHAGLSPGAYVRIDVRDTGPGMSAEVQRRIFEPFFTTKAPGEGTGLGLAVVHGIMQQHGGAVTLYSQPGRGSLFHLYLPAVDTDPASGERRRPTAPPQGGGERVLFVDDDLAIGEAARQMLRRLGYDAVVCGRADEALARWRETPDAFAVLVSDLTMPGMTGLEFLKAVRELRPGQRFVLTSGYFGDAELAEARAHGVKHLLSKPLSYADLGNAIANALSAE